ncbi:MAG: sulfur oxidation c-type cytochrome SoxA, partial [Gammaproteobacteria bacterium]|nr:sulfur oxidation c-type cytochrome SoxA [Gammaproteobacteria bacterium]
MKVSFKLAGLLCMSLLLPAAGMASPQSDLKKYQKYYQKNFPQIKQEEFGNGIYAIDMNLREQWEAMEEFPPYEIAVDEGKRLFETPFKNGKTYASCFKNGGIGIAQDYPYFDEKQGKVVTLALAINDCRKANGEEPLGWKKGKIAAINAYMAYTSRGNNINVKV